MNRLVIILVLLGQVLFLYGQSESPYQLKLKKELILSATTGTAVGFGYYFKSKTQPLTDAEVLAFEIQEINSFDQIAHRFNSLQADRGSDYLMYGSAIANLAFLIPRKTRKDFVTISAMWGEAILMNSGAVMLSKYTIRRARPYVYDPAVDLSRKQRVNSRASFFSGHTSMTAVNTFFFAKVYADYYPNSRWKPMVWTTAAIIPAVTGLLRVRAGKHYPTDVLFGYAVGASIGMLVPHLHIKKDKNRQLSVYGSTNGLAMNFQF